MGIFDVVQESPRVTYLDDIGSFGIAFWEEEARTQSVFVLSLLPEVYKIIDESEGFYINKARAAMSIWPF